MKKLFIISGSFFLLVLVFLAVYNFAFRHNNADPVADPKKKEELEKKREGESEAVTRSVAFHQILTESVLYPVAGENSLFYYSKRDGALKEATLDGKEVTVRIERIPGTPSRIVWSPSRLGALILTKESGGDLWYYADLRNKLVTPLKRDMSRLAWTSLGDRILYQYTDATTGERSLNIAFPDGSNWSKLADLGKDDHFIMALPQSSLVAVWPRTDGNRESALEVMNINGENRRTILTGKFGADFLWSPNSQRLLVQSVTERGGHTLALGLTDENGSGYKNLFAPTLVSKIAWSKDNETFYYALPGTFPADAVMPNDYFGKPINSKDTFWKMNVRTGKKERLVPLEEMTEAFDATDVFLAPTETDLYFVERVSGKLYRITL
ncbi:MAG: hypothetical protein E6R05_04615 [Candidatus Moraniibacteriota bacterium]|nr:MAG: hypothetical protein E6R05_04615 [Candidatus Moranbacteria bacterium]